MEQEKIPVYPTERRDISRDPKSAGAPAAIVALAIDPNQDPEVRKQALNALLSSDLGGKISKEDWLAIRQLASQDKDPNIRKAVLAVIATYDRTAEGTKVLLAALRDPSVEVDRWAARLISVHATSLGGDRSAFVNALAPEMKNPDIAIRKDVHEALWRIVCTHPTNLDPEATRVLRDISPPLHSGRPPSSRR